MLFKIEEIAMKMLQVLFFALFLCPVWMVCVCAGQGTSSISRPSRDAWYNEPRSFPEYLHIKGQLVDTGRVFEVNADQEAEAERMLDISSVVGIDLQTAKRFAGDRITDLQGYSLFLTRGLYYSKDSGNWRVHELGDKLQVVHRGLGKQTPETHRQVLVILLKQKPVQVYTFCDTTE